MCVLLWASVGSDKRSGGTNPSVNSGYDSEGGSGFVPWRDCKLTRLLQDCLGGASQVSLVINVGPGALNANESINSLMFGRRSMQVRKADAEIEINSCRYQWSLL